MTTQKSRWLGAAALAVLVVTLFSALSAVSAQTPPMTASIGDDLSDHTRVHCNRSVWADSACDLQIRATNHYQGERDITVAFSNFAKILDSTEIKPDDTSLTKQTIGDCPCTYAIPGNSTELFRLRIAPTPGANSAGHYVGFIKVYFGSDRSGRKLAEYQLTVKVPTPTSIAAEEYESTRIAVRWKMDERATTSIIAWWPRDDRSAKEYAVRLKGVRYRIISNLQPSTCYVINVQPIATSRTIKPAQTEGSTTTTGTWSDTPGDACTIRPEEPYVPTTKTAGGITISDARTDPWAPMIWVGNQHGPFDHIMGESEHLTYQVSMADAAACPATVDVRGRPRFVIFGEWSHSQRIRLIAGSSPPPLSDTDAWAPAAEIATQLTFTAEDCLTPQEVTVYGLTDFPLGLSLDWTASLVGLKHTLTRRSGHPTSTRGPVLNIYAEDRPRIELSAAVPEATGDTTTQTIGGESIVFDNNIGPSSRAGEPIPARGRRFRQPVVTIITGGKDGSTQQSVSGPWQYPIPDNQKTYVFLPRSTDPTVAAPWVEFCIYIHALQKSLKLDEAYGYGRVVAHKYPRSYANIGLASVTLFPVEHGDHSWSFGGGQDSVNRHYGYPIELQRYTIVDSDDSKCRLQSVFDSGNTGEWQTVYSGGPATLKPDGSPSDWTDSSVEFAMPQSDWDKLINVRMRAVYGLPTGIDDTDHNLTLKSGTTTGGEAYSYRHPDGTVMYKFAVTQMRSVESRGSIMVLFGDADP